MTSQGREDPPGRSHPLPLFPLRTVLFPGGLLPLRVFEQRYVTLVKQCLQDGSPFGVCLITEGEEVMRAGPAGAKAPAFANVGTEATILTWDMADLGILHVRTQGGRRFQVVEHAVRRDGLVVADVRPIPDEPRVPLAPEFRRVANLLDLLINRIGPEQFPEPRALDDASWVGYRLAEILPLPATAKQSMLEINDSGVRLAVLARFLEQQALL